MNKAIIMGNLTRDPDMRATSNQVSVCSFTVAVERRFKDASGNRPVDFINCVAWRQQADFVAKYFAKGNRIVVIGAIQTRNYDDRDGNKRTATEIIADEIYFGEKLNNGSQPAHEEPPAIPDDFDATLPFDL